MATNRLEEIRARDAEFKLPLHLEYNTAAEHDRRWLLEQLDVCVGALRDVLPFTCACPEGEASRKQEPPCVYCVAKGVLAALSDNTPPAAAPAAEPCPGTPVDHLAFGRPNPRRKGQYTEGEHCACCAKGALTEDDRTYLDTLKTEIGSDRYLWALIDRLMARAVEPRDE